MIPGKCYRTPKLTRFGYITLNARQPVFGQAAEEIGEIPAHEFHYFDSENCGTDFHASNLSVNEDGTVYTVRKIFGRISASVLLWQSEHSQSVSVKVSGISYSTTLCLIEIKYVTRSLIYYVILQYICPGRRFYP